MMPRKTLSEGARIVAAALLAFALAAPGCGRPPDEAWLRFLGFRASGETTALTTINGDLNDGKTDSADAAFSNASITVSGTSSSTGTGILVKSARVNYKMSGYSPPPEEYTLSLYLAPSSVSSGTVTATEGTVADFPVASASLKQWLLDTHAFDASGGTADLRLTANVTFSAETDDGTDLEVAGSIAVVLSNGGTDASPQTVNIAATTATASSSADGEFTVTRTGPTTDELTVYYSLGGTAEAGTDYATLDGAVAIAAGETSATITITLLSDYTAGRTVTATITESSTYTVGTRSTATLTLQ